PGLEIRGRLARGGAPLAGARVRLGRRGGTLVPRASVPLELLCTRDATDAVAGELDPDPPAYPGRFWKGTEMRTDGDGSFRFTGLEDRAWSLGASADDGASLCVEGLRAPVDLGTLEVSAPVTLAGRVEFAVPGRLDGHTIELESVP